MNTRLKNKIYCSRDIHLYGTLVNCHTESYTTCDEILRRGGSDNHISTAIYTHIASMLSMKQQNKTLDCDINTAVKPEGSYNEIRFIGICPQVAELAQIIAGGVWGDLSE